MVYALMPKSIIREEVQCVLAEFLELMSNEFPQGLPYINLIPGFNLPNKLVYRLSPKKAERFAETGGVVAREWVYPGKYESLRRASLLIPKKDGSYYMCVDSRAIK